VGTLYLVATPIGNLEDISARALRTLREVRLIAAEDTRRTRKLLAHYDIHTPLSSYYEHNKLSKLEEILASLAEGDVALVSDAGTPLINDPGYELVLAALDAGYAVLPIPGPSAPIAALSASGLPADTFLYLGYLPRKTKPRRALLQDVKDDPYTAVFLEAPHRLLDSLRDMLDVLGDRQMAAARELTKLHEEIFRGRISEALKYFLEHTPRGEFTLVVSGREGSKERWPEDRLRSELSNYLQSGESPSSIAGLLAKESGWPRREIYQIIIRTQSKDQ
jgi:16S rRNA (cytidine1402-2'-O)-methyltransferase